MAEQPHNRSNTPLNFPSTPECGHWETLLVDALDGVLRPEDEAIFSGHMAVCDGCSAMFEQARRGREWLEFLAPEPEVPAYLLDRILAETGGGKSAISPMGVGNLATAGGSVIAMPPVWQRPGFTGRMRRFAEPRLLMTAAMAFFSIALTLSMTGVRISGFKAADLRPTAVRSMLERRIMTASTPIIRYYDHLRFVYEVESRMKELRRSNEIEQKTRQSRQSNQPEGETHRKDGGTKLNPNEAPQQTVNPPVSLWGSEPLETWLELPRSQFFESGNEAGKGITTPTKTSELTHMELANEMQTGVLARPERSQS